MSYHLGQYSLSYLQTKNGAEIDLIIERAGEKTVCLEINSGTVLPKHLNNLKDLTADIPNSYPVCLYDGPDERMINNTQVLPWRLGLERLGIT